MPDLLTPHRPAAARQSFTDIERTDATEPIYLALVRQQEIVAPRTTEAFATHVGASALAAYIVRSVGEGTVGTGTIVGLSHLGGGIELGPTPAVTYPLAAPTGASAALTGIPETRWALASEATRPLVQATPLAGVFDFVFDRPIERVRIYAPAPSRAYRTFTQIARWLGMTQAEAAHVLAVGRTTPLAWRRGREPRPARARRLYQTHALLKTLVRRLGVDETRRWLARGEPSPLELLAAGDVTAADNEAALGAPAYTRSQCRTSPVRPRSA